MKLESIESIEKLQPLKGDWNTFIEKSEDNNIFFTWEWITSWCEYFLGNNNLLILFGYNENNELIGIAPLIKISRWKCGIKVMNIEFIGSGNEIAPTHLNFITLTGYEADFIHNVFEYLEDNKKLWDIIVLRDMQQDSRILKNLDAIVKNNGGYELNSTPGSLCPYIELPETWEQYIAGLTKKTRYNIGKKERNLAADHKIEYVIWNDSQTLEPMMRKLEELHQKRMRKKKIDGFSMRPIFWDFHRSIANKLQEKGWLFLGALKADDNIISCAYGYFYNNKVSIYQTGLDTDYNNYSANYCLFAHLIKESINRKCSEFDFLKGNQSYKFHFTDKVRKNINLIVWNKGFKVQFVRFQVKMKAFLKSLIKPANDIAPEGS